MSYLAGISIANRMVSGFPLSIGTALAMESLFTPIQRPYDPERKIPQKVDLGQYSQCLINLKTLYRNLAGSMEKMVFSTADPGDILATLIEEIGIINDLFMQEGKGCVPVFYYSTHDDLKSRVKRNSYVSVRLREAKTESQLYYERQYEHCLKAINERTDTLVHYKDHVTGDKYPDAVILTHEPWDLIGFRDFRTLDLLESNTGVLKQRDQWWTKLHPFGSQKLDHIPFHKKTLLVFGDKSTIHPGHLSMRQAVYDVSTRRNWTSVTTLEKVNLDLQTCILDPALAAILKSYT